MTKQLENALFDVAAHVENGLTLTAAIRAASEWHGLSIGQIARVVCSMSKDNRGF